MNSTALRTLLAVEDNAGDARLLREMLNEQGGHNTALLHATSMADAAAAQYLSPQPQVSFEAQTTPV